MTITKNQVVTVGVLALTLATAAAVKLIFFPSVKEVYFAPGSQYLQQVPGGLMVIRPTHFAKSSRTGIFYASISRDGKNVQRMMGRCVSLREMMAAAYRKNPSRVVLPSDAPTGAFDFIDTAADRPNEHLQTAIRRKLGYVAEEDTRDMDVLALKVVDSSLPGMTPSRDDEKRNISFNGGKLNFTHMRVTAITDGLEQMLKTPVVDKTDLTNFYDYSVTWDRQVQRKMQNADTARDTVDGILRGWGLELDADTVPIKVLAVKRAN